MESKELRIGNLFYKIDRTQKVHMPIEVPMVVAEIGIPFVKFYPLGTPIHQVVKYFDVELFSMTPIPLTEEWLLKFGFGKSEEHEYGCNTHEIFGFYYDYHFNKFYLDTPNEQVCIPFIKYVHQLQNLYFSLCGKELEINAINTK